MKILIEQHSKINCQKGSAGLLNNRRGVATGDVIFMVVLLTLFITGGFLIRNVVLNLRTLDMAKFDLDAEFRGLEQTIQDAFVALTGLATTKNTPPISTPGPKKKIEVTSLRFFEAGQNAPAAKDRSYKNVFPRNSRIIYTEIGYKNNRHKIADAEIPVRIEFYGLNGQKAGEISAISRPKKEWASVLFVIRWTPTEAGSWKADQYTAKIFLEDTLAAEQKFEIK